MDLYSLPEWNFVGGEYQRRQWTLYRQDGQVQDVSSTTVSLAVDDYANPAGTPILKKTTQVSTNEDGLHCNVLFELLPEDTKDLAGTYMYQLTLKQSDRTTIPFRGIMHIAQNIDKEALA